MKETIEIKCSVPSSIDEKDAGGLWDLAAYIAFIAGSEARKSYLLKDNKAPIYAEDFGQEAIYNCLRSYVQEDEDEEED